MEHRKFDLPLGLGMALAQNVKAMERFSSLSDGEKEKIINKAHAVNSKSEMQSFVAGLAGENGGATM
ncbi:MAG: hypothetical protein PHW77_06640 [Eubacteriales bacterium]|nr:hypothetical protein [Eubacteriales bacterium]